jgi:hypothetical protein
MLYSRTRTTYYEGTILLDIRRIHHQSADVRSDGQGVAILEYTVSYPYDRTTVPPVLLARSSTGTAVPVDLLVLLVVGDL